MGSEEDRKELEIKRETLQLERDELRRKIAELLESEYARLEAEADRIAPGFDYEKEAEELKAEEAEELARFTWKDEDVHEPKHAKKEQSPQAVEKPLPAAKVSRSRYPKARHIYRTRIGEALFGDKNRRVLTAAILMLVCFGGWQAWDRLVPKAVALSYTTYEGTERATYMTTAATAGEVMDELAAGAVIGGTDIRVSENDLMSTSADTAIKNGTVIEILKAGEAKASIAGAERTLRLVPGTVEENLRLNGIAFDDDDEIKPALTKQVDEDTRITVNEIHYEVGEKTEKVESESRVILDPSLTSGVQETTEGNDGEGVFTYTTKYVNGENSGTEREVKEWITEPHDTVLRLGTSRTGNSGEYTVKKTFTANTTAYTAGSGAKGALGQSVHVGTCAVDPRYVSLRSELWIEGYGYAYANDTGGAVKGNVVDLYMSSRSQCVSWGRRNKTAYVIVPGGD